MWSSESISLFRLSVLAPTQTLKAVGPIVAVARQEAHPFVIPDDDRPVAIILDLMEPFLLGRDRPAGSRNAGRVDASHVPQIGVEA